MDDTKLTLFSLFPKLRDAHVIKNILLSTTFIGIDFGTSTTVASYARYEEGANPLRIETIPIRQKFKSSAGVMSESQAILSHLVPSALAWHDGALYFGAGAYDLKHQSEYGKNFWHSFKMKLGVDRGIEYYYSELNGIKTKEKILCAQDAARYFFGFLIEEIRSFVRSNRFPEAIQFCISTPASFEANQREDLLKALKPHLRESEEIIFIDEPNAAFLSYLHAMNNNDTGSYTIPSGAPLHILVFDFGAGTCDLSLLELGKTGSGIYSKNRAISQFHALGGNNIDKAIAERFLLEQLFDENGITRDEIRTPDLKKRFLPQLEKTAEQLKIKICKNIAGLTVGDTLPEIAHSDMRIESGGSITIQAPKSRYTLEQPALTYAEFAELMDDIFNNSSEGESDTCIKQLLDHTIKKSGIDKDHIDMVLLIGGSSQNPYLQHHLRNYFSEADMELPQDMRTPVSTGAALNALITHGFGRPLIRPITAEPILFVTSDAKENILLPAGTEIPSEEFVIDGLQVTEDGQQEIDIPICVSSKDKILSVIHAASQGKSGFSKYHTIKLRGKINAAKMLEIGVEMNGAPLVFHTSNPFTNVELSIEEREVIEAEKDTNNSAFKNSGKPPLSELRRLTSAYLRSGNHLRAAETMDIALQIYKGSYSYTSLCYHYSLGGNELKSDQFCQRAYQEEKSEVSAYNYALLLMHDDIPGALAVLNEALRYNRNYAPAKLLRARLIKTSFPEESKRLFKEVYAEYKEQLENDNLDPSDCERLREAAREVGDTKIIGKINSLKNRQTKQNAFSDLSLIKFREL